MWSELWSRERKGEEAHLGWMMTRVLSASLCGTAGRGKRSWKQALGGCGWNSDFREGSVMEGPVY